MSATQSGVPAASTTNQDTENQDHALPTERSARETAMEALERSRIERFAAESGNDANTMIASVQSDDGEDYDAEAEARERAAAEAKASKAKPAGTDKQDDDQLAAQMNEDARVLTDGLDKTLVTVKIDGEERQVSIAEMQRQFQKNGAAEKRLAEAARRQKELDEREALLNAQQNSTTTKGVANNDDRQGSTNATQVAGVGEAGKEFLASLFDGDEDKALEALDKLLGGRQQTTLDPNDLVRQLTPALKQQLIVESASEQFQKDFPHIVNDQYLAQVADRYVEEAVAEGMSLADAILESGKRTQDWINEKAGIKKSDDESGKSDANDSRTTTRSNNRLDKKREAAQHQVRGTTLVANSGQEAPQRETPSSVIAQMRQQRGLDREV